MMFSTLITAAELFAHHNKPGWVVVDCRFDLAKPGWGQESYREGHIPGAVYAHLDRDLSGPITPTTGRHPLPDVETFTRTLEGWGIGGDTQVVAYDTTGGSYAGRLWWLLRYLGHNAAAVVDGGWQAWGNAGYPTASGEEAPKRTGARFDPNPQPQMVVSADEVERLRSDPAYRLIDARAPERYRGETEPIDPVAGRIPGAVNRFHMDNLTPDRTLRSAAELRAAFLDLLGGVPPERAVVYCGSGVTSIHHLLAMEAAGLPMGKLYAGSWSEWIRDPKRAVGKDKP